MPLLSIWWPAGLVVAIFVLTAYTGWADRKFTRGGTWRAVLSTRLRRHPRIMAAQLLCLAVLVVVAVVQSRY
jgi:hypothetical protein